jgi:DNA-binding NarL/FixJ family response regulator
MEFQTEIEGDSVSNPWRLTDRQAQVLDALVRLGCNKMIARELGLKKPDTVSMTIFRACEKIGAANRVQAAVAWDRWQRAHRA